MIRSGAVGYDPWVIIALTIIALTTGNPLHLFIKCGAVEEWEKYDLTRRLERDTKERSTVLTQ